MQGLDFFGAEQGIEQTQALFTAVDAPAQRRQFLHDFVGDCVAGKVPQYRPQFVFVVKGDAVVDGPQAPIIAFEAMATFAIGVIDNGIKNC